MALIIISASIFYTNVLVNRFADEERTRVKVWAETVQRRIQMIDYNEGFYSQISKQERERVELFAKAYRRVLDGSTDEDLTFFVEIIRNNNSIPVIVADEQGKILMSKNLLPGEDTIAKLTGDLLARFSVYEPISIQYSFQNRNILYYRESRVFSDLKRVMDDLVSSFLAEVASNASSVPVIITDSSAIKVLQYGNLDHQKMQDSVYVQNQLALMAAENTPIELNFLDYGKTLIYYKSSELLHQMQFFPMVQILIIALFLLIAYLLFSYARRSEQNQVWAGMAKETAHQIGTPLSSLIAWIELLKINPNQIEGIDEMEKDVQRLELITERFSKIGSPPILEPANLIAEIEETIDYLRVRSSKKVDYQLIAPVTGSVILPMNVSLFMWVIENLCKNAIDAMGGSGKIKIIIKDEADVVKIDISDTGKGIQKADYQTIFNPGFTSKKRGWGLGLTLAQRIVREYHKGKIYVKSSTIGEGTTFRIVLNK
ncbi:MAG: HAMP domain-containing histidine kinase [Bacteroidales bacterium]|nr:HAMP domain-containing histidine kinase [Bacteroidales bacterium]